MRYILIAFLALFACYLPITLDSASIPICKCSRHYITPSDQVQLFFGRTHGTCIEVFFGYADQDPGGLDLRESVRITTLRSDQLGIYYLDEDVIGNVLIGGT